MCSKLVIPNESDSALVIHGKQNKITRNDFLSFSDYLDIPQKVRDHILEKIRAILEKANPNISDSYLPDEDQEKMILEKLRALPEEILEDIIQFIEFLENRRGGKSTGSIAGHTGIGGLWKDVDISEEDIEEVRRDMWGK